MLFLEKQFNVNARRVLPAGLSLVELMFSLSIIAIVLTATLSLYVTHRVAQQAAEERRIASLAARQELDEIRIFLSKGNTLDQAFAQYGPFPLPTGGPGATFSVPSLEAFLDTDPRDGMRLNPRAVGTVTIINAEAPREELFGFDYANGCIGPPFGVDINGNGSRIIETGFGTRGAAGYKDHIPEPFPLDLNDNGSDGSAKNPWDANVVSGFKILPVVITIQWRGLDGPRRFDLFSIITPGPFGRGQAMKTNRYLTQRARGVSLLEITFAMAILSGAFIAVLYVMSFLAGAMTGESGRGDPFAGAMGAQYDLGAELCETAAFSPHFYIEQDPQKAPRITFDKIEGLDSAGGMVWGSTITYRLEAMNGSIGDITMGRLVRDEVSNLKDVPATTMTIQENIPYRYTQNGAAAWGFNVTLEGHALTLSTSRFGSVTETPATANRNVNTSPLSSKSTALQLAAGSAAAEASSVTRSKPVLSVTSIYYLRNPQAIIPAQ